MTHDIRAIIASGSQLTKQQDDEAYALLSPEEYYAIPEGQKPDPDSGYSDQQVKQSYTVQSLHNLQNDWCVYSVNELFLGCCKLSQLFMIPDVARSITFKTVITDTQSITVTLLGQFPSDVAAIRHRDALMTAGAYLKPDSGPTVKPHTIRCVSDGSTFPNVPAAATHYAISVQSVYNSINGLREAPRGLNFERI